MEIIKLNLIPSGVNPTCHCSQYDNGRVIRIELFDGLTPYVLQSGDTVTLNVRKPDNTIVTASVTATQGNNYVDIETTEQICAVVGYNLCDLTITNGSVVIGTLNFIMAIERDVLADGIPSQSVIEDLEELVQAAVGDNYYTKTETYNKTEINNALAAKASASEVEDIRNGADGITYDSAGNAVRAQINNLNSVVKEISEKGVNLLPLENISKTLCNVDCNYSGGVLVRNGTANFSTNSLFYSNLYLKAGTYTFWSDNAALNVLLLIDKNNTVVSKINDASIGTFTLTEPKLLDLYITFVNNRVYSNITSKIMLESGDTPTIWEAPYISALDKKARQDLKDISESIIGGNTNLTPIETSQMYNSNSELKDETDTHKFYKVDLPEGVNSLTLVQASPTAFTNHWYNEYDENGNLLHTETLSITSSPFTININDNQTKYIKLSIWVVNGAFSLTGYIYGIIDQKIDQKISVINRYSYVSALGDSITHGLYYDNGVQKYTENTYQKLLANYFNATFQNLGINSTPISSTSDYTGGQNNNAFCRRYTSINANADYIIVAGGTNDWGHNTPFGNVSDTTDVGFYGALDVLINGLLSTYPNARLVFVTPFQRDYVNGDYDPDTNVNAQGKTLKDYCDAIKLKCEQYGIQCVDGYAKSGINKTSVCKTNFAPDGLHPNPQGHLKIYKNLLHELI